MGRSSKEVRQYRVDVELDQALAIAKLRVLRGCSTSDVIGEALRVYFSHFNDRFEERECLGLWKKEGPRRGA